MINDTFNFGRKRQIPTTTVIITILRINALTDIITKIKKKNVIFIITHI